MHHALKPGGRIVIADCFCRDASKSSNKIETKSLEHFEKDWGVPGLWDIGETVKKLEKQGFKAIRVEDISMRVMPSVMHTPYVIAKFLWSKRKTRLLEQNKATLRGVLAAVGLGVNLHKYGYFLVSGTKK
jgi:hypothetical protein